MTANKEKALEALLHPQSVAVVGATERVGASSGFVMRNLLNHGYKGRIYPVHPQAKTLFGLTAVSHIAHLPTPPDVAVICIPAQHVAGALAAAGEAGTKAAVILSSGFAEQDEAGRARQKEIVAIAAAHNMAVCGPNCLGLVGLHSHTALYSSRFPYGVAQGAFALISQSGASAIALSSTGRLGFSYIISSGNSAVTDTADYLQFLATDSATRVIGLVLENVSHPPAFAAAMRAVQAANKQVIALYIGRSNVGAAATAAHTGALSSTFAAASAFLRRQGVIVVESMDELLETAVLQLTLRQPIHKEGVGLIGVSGGGVAHAADFADAAGLELPGLAPETVAQLHTILPTYTTPQNPLDLTGLPFADGSVYQKSLDALASDPAIGLVVAVQDAPVGLDEDGAREYLPIAQGIGDFAATAAVPVVVVSNLSGGHHPLFRQPLQAAGVPLLNGAEAALRAIKHSRKSAAQKMVAATIPLAHSFTAAWRKRFETGVPFTEREVKRLLHEHDIPTTREGLATTVDEAVALARQIGFPVVLKIESAEILHKTEVGGVCLNIGDETAVRQAFAQLLQNAAAYAPTAQLQGVVVQEMVASSVEAFVGISRHHPFGFGIVVGVGGVLVELLAETSFDLLPLDEELASALVAKGPLSKLLAGFRGAPPADRAALVAAILQLARIVETFGDYIDTVELNPIAVLPQGKGVCALDGLLLLQNRNRNKIVAVQ